MSWLFNLYLGILTGILLAARFQGQSLNQVLNYAVNG